ncbi:TadE/TadG family type IV pilus assembly protein [Tropicimonas sp. IMCC6043]|uniref:TadE/TadG family type IV pilus assembly protein n=1 Tax=Tropicimonas sp. IMCC6043 TaxID=2510645 RepID=UPI00101C275E|nr:flp pilus-assembly TadE/G-like family protein [Tropicimonas sp. IMCC6043]RYH10378.1 hypothetical protein EU800_08820 [Tropicimonas sp. IMCC6043]
MHRFGLLLRRFLRSEFGGGTIFSIYALVTFIALLGIMLDPTNAWLNRTRITATSDIGAHAGAVALAKGGGLPEVKLAVQEAVEDNLPRGIFGKVLDTSTDVALAHYDPYSRKFDNNSAVDPNAVVVWLERSRDRQNPMYTFLLKFAGLGAFETEALSVAVFDINAKCKPTEGIYARGKVTLTTQARIGEGYCLHSESYVWLPQQNEFEQNTWVSMPNLALCEDKCVESANPGINPIESHQILPDLRQWVLDTYADFNSASSAAKTEFFKDVALGDVQELRDDGIIGPTETAPPVGTVINLTPDQFHGLERLPNGLVYNVQCSPGGNGEKTRLTFNGTTAQMEKVALVTNCSLDFQDGSRLIGSVIVTTRELATATVTSGSSVTVADPSLSCGAGERTWVMALSDVNVPAEFVMSNLTMVVDGNVDIASATSASATSMGLSIWATGRVSIASQHGFSTCPNQDDYLTPVAKLLRLVDPESSEVTKVVSMGG